MHITILVPGHGVASTVIGPQEVFGNTGIIWQALHGDEAAPEFSVVTASEDGSPVRYYENLDISVDYAVDEIEHTDLVFAPTIGMDIDHVLAQRPRMLEFVARQAERGSLIAGVCTGVSFLAETGLLDGRPGTTHWALVERFRKRYPKVIWQPEKFITESGKLFCGGGVYAALDLCMYLVEYMAGFSAARECGRAMLIDPPRTSQASFGEPILNRKHQDSAILQAEDFIGNHFREPISVNDMAASINMSPRNFSRRFRQATGEAPLTYLHKLRIRAARQLLETDSKTVNEICLEVGYEDVPHFRELFKRHTGLTPSEYRERFGHRVGRKAMVAPAV